jgi:D-glycero-D-manno-heptose 1,7-bisphosphate phosphatase
MNAAEGGRSAVFLDKDGTLLEDVPFNVDPRRMKLAEGAPAALGALAETGLPLFVVSNQSGVARGLFEARALEAVERRLREMFAECGAHMEGFYYCPHHPLAAIQSYAVLCCCRKPEPGMIFRAAAEHGIDPANSWMVGDILDDIEAGRRAGCTTILVDNGNETEWQLSSRRLPHHRVARLDEAARLIVSAQHALSQRQEGIAA